MGWAEYFWGGRNISAREEYFWWAVLQRLHNGSVNELKPFIGLPPQPVLVRIQPKLDVSEGHRRVGKRIHHLPREKRVGEISLASRSELGARSSEPKSRAARRRN